MKLIEKMETDALSFMQKRKKKEEEDRKKAIKIIDKLERDISSIIKAQGNISLSFVNQFISSEISPIINNYREEHNSLMDNIIRDEFNIGLTNGQRLLQLTNEKVEALGEVRDSIYEEVLIALLLYNNSIIDNLYSDTVSNLNKDITSIYITNKNQRDYNDVDKDIQTNNSTVNTILTGAIISRYINSTFNNIRNRADLIAQNEINRALNHGHLIRYLKANLKYVKWVEVRDRRLCKHCKAAANEGINGNGVYLIDAVNPPPLHPRCRCILIPWEERWVLMEY